jgi:hypothetical protein
MGDVPRQLRSWASAETRDDEATLLKLPTTPFQCLSNRLEMCPSTADVHIEKHSGRPER